jgi:hypothetical protein
MLRPIDLYFQQQEEPGRTCLLFLRDYLQQYDSNITETWKYRMPFYCYKNKMFAYLWTRKKTGQPYLGIVEGIKIDHPLLLQEDRSRMKILLLDPATDIPLDTINTILDTALQLYR